MEDVVRIEEKMGSFTFLIFILFQILLIFSPSLLSLVSHLIGLIHLISSVQLNNMFMIHFLFTVYLVLVCVIFPSLQPWCFQMQCLYTRCCMCVCVFLVISYSTFEMSSIYSILGALP